MNRNSLDPPTAVTGFLTKPPHLGWVLLAALFVAASCANYAAFQTGRITEREKYAPVVRKFNYWLHRDSTCLSWIMPEPKTETP